MAAAGAPPPGAGSSVIARRLSASRYGCCCRGAEVRATDSPPTGPMRPAVGLARAGDVPRVPVLVTALQRRRVIAAGEYAIQPSRPCDVLMATLCCETPESILMIAADGSRASGHAQVDPLALKRNGSEPGSSPNPHGPENRSRFWLPLGLKSLPLRHKLDVRTPADREAGVSDGVCGLDDHWVGAGLDRDLSRGFEDALSYYPGTRGARKAPRLSVLDDKPRSGSGVERWAVKDSNLRPWD